MAAISGAVRVATRSRMLTPSLKQWTFGARRYKSYGGTSYGSYNRSTLSVLLATVVPIVVGSWLASIYRRRSHKQFDSVGLAETRGKKAVEYEKEGALHPEAEAEALLTAKVETSSNNKPTQSCDVPISNSKNDTSIPSHVPYVLVGAGTASFAAAKAIRQKDPQAKVLIIGNEDYTPYSRPPLSKQLWLYEDHEATKQLKFKASWSGGKLVDPFYKADFCSPKVLADKEDGGIAVMTGRQAVSLDPRKKKIKLDNGFELSYDKCLLATGGRPRNLTLFTDDNEELKKRVSTFRTIPDYKFLDSLLDKVGSILIIGGGFLGSELAVGLATRGRDKNVKISQAFPEVGNLGLVLPKDLSKWTTEKVRKEGVEVFPGSCLKGVSVQDGKVRVTTEDGKELDADHVVVAVGIDPNTNLSKSSHLEVDSVLGGYQVNAELQACTDVWVAGDVACFYDPYLGRRRVEHHDHANVSGRLAGQNMAGSHERFDHQSMFWSDIGPDVGFEATGKIDAKLPTVGIFARKSSEPVETPEDDYSKGVVFYLEKEKGKIVGVLTWNMFGKMEVARQILSEEKTEADIGDLSSHFEIH